MRSICMGDISNYVKNTASLDVSRRRGASRTCPTAVPRYATSEPNAVKSATTECILTRDLDGRSINWSEVAKAIPGRSNKDCRKRFFNKVTGGLKKVAESPLSQAWVTLGRSLHELGSVVWGWGCETRRLRKGSWHVLGADSSEDGDKECRSYASTFNSPMTSPTLTYLVSECSKRWQHCLDPKLDHSVWTEQEVCYPSLFRK